MLPDPPTLRRAVMAALVLCTFIWSAPALAQIAPLTAPQRANVQLVVDNLNGMVAAGRAAIGPKDPKADVEKAQLDRLAEVARNLAAKLAAGSVHSVPGLTSKSPRNYRHGNDLGSPRAAYCDDDTWVRNGAGWDHCREGDILVDGGILDPGNGVAITEANFAGWQQKWTLLHVLTHEKMHEILINEQVAILRARAWWGAKPETEKAKLIRIAKAEGATNDKHQEVYEMQKNALRWEAGLLELQLKALQAARPKNQAAINDMTAKIKWLRDTVTTLETAMAKATQGVEFADILGCVPETPKTGYVEAVIDSPGLTWTLEADREGGVTHSVTTLGSDWLGEPVTENTGHQPAMVVTMDEAVLSAGEMQPQLCDYVGQARAAGGLTVQPGPAKRRDDSRAVIQGVGALWKLTHPDHGDDDDRPSSGDHSDHGGRD